MSSIDLLLYPRLNIHYHKFQCIYITPFASHILFFFHFTWRTQSSSLIQLNFCYFLNLKSFLSKLAPTPTFFFSIVEKLTKTFIFACLHFFLVFFSLKTITIKQPSNTQLKLCFSRSLMVTLTNPMVYSPSSLCLTISSLWHNLSVNFTTDYFSSS